MLTHESSAPGILLVFNFKIKFVTVLLILAGGRAYDFFPEGHPRRWEVTLKTTRAPNLSRKIAIP